MIIWHCLAAHSLPNSFWLVFILDVLSWCLWSVITTISWEERWERGAPLVWQWWVWLKPDHQAVPRQVKEKLRCLLEQLPAVAYLLIFSYLGRRFFWKSWKGAQFTTLCRTAGWNEKRGLVEAEMISFWVTLIWICLSENAVGRSHKRNATERI